MFICYAFGCLIVPKLQAVLPIFLRIPCLALVFSLVRFGNGMIASVPMRSSWRMWAIISHVSLALQWGHNGRDDVSNHQPHDCLLNCLFRCISKKTSKLRVTGICVGNSPVTSEFPVQMASNAETVSTSWRHHGNKSQQNRVHVLLHMQCRVLQMNYYIVKTSRCDKHVRTK